MTLKLAFTANDLRTVSGWFFEDPTLAMSIGSESASIDVEKWLNERMDARELGLIEDNDELVCVVTVHPRISETSGVVHILVGPKSRGRGVEIARHALCAAKEMGFTHLLAPSSKSIPAPIHERWLRQAGFTIHHHGEWHA